MFSGCRKIFAVLHRLQKFKKGHVQLISVLDNSVNSESVFIILSLAHSVKKIGYYTCRVESSRVGTFVVGAELAVQSQQRRTTVHDTHSCSQHCLVLEQVGLELALE